MCGKVSAFILGALFGIIACLFGTKIINIDDGVNIVIATIAFIYMFTTTPLGIGLATGLLLPYIRVLMVSYPYLSAFLTLTVSHTVLFPFNKYMISSQP